MDQLLTVKQAAQRLACSEAAIRKWIYQGRLKAVKVGRLTRLRERDLDILLERGLPLPSGERIITNHADGVATTGTTRRPGRVRMAPQSARSSTPTSSPAWGDGR